MERKEEWNEKELYLQELYNHMPAFWQRWYRDIVQGKRTLPFMYDRFFKFIFDPDVHAQRLERFISALLEKKVKIKRLLPNEGSIIADNGSMLILDIIVELEDGSLANVEIQKVPYHFPAERMSCYSSDLVMRQYSRLRGEKGSGNTYSDMQKVYTIVIFENTVSAFHDKKQYYIHRGRTTFDTGLELELLQEYCLVALDIFKKFHYDKEVTECAGWMSFLTVSDVKEIPHLIEMYPWLKEMYDEAAAISVNQEEVLSMFSESLRIMDRNSMQYMIDEMEEELKQKEETLRGLDGKLQEKDVQLQKVEEELQSKDEELQSKDEELQSKDEELQSKDEELQLKEEELRRQKEEIARLKEQLAQQERE